MTSLVFITQAADPATPIQANYSTYLASDVDSNGNPYEACIEMRSYLGSLYAFVNDGPALLPSPAASGKTLPSPRKVQFLSPHLTAH